jgi:hypothetical protein
MIPVVVHFETEGLLVSSEREIETADILEVVLTCGCAGDVIGAEVGVQIVVSDI